MSALRAEAHRHVGGRVAYSTTFRDRLKARLEVRQLSGRALARACRVDPSLVTRWLNGFGEPKLDTLILCARALDTDPNWLIGWKEASRG